MPKRVLVFLAIALGAVLRAEADGMLDPSFGNGGIVKTNFFPGGSSWDGAGSLVVLPDGRGFAWGGGEAALMAQVRAVLNDKGVPREATRVSAYWKRGVAEHHENL